MVQSKSGLRHFTKDLLLHSFLVGAWRTASATARGMPTGDLIYSGITDLGSSGPRSSLISNCLRFGPKRFDAVQLGGEGILGSRLAVEGDGEQGGLHPGSVGRHLLKVREFDESLKRITEAILGLVLVILYRPTNE